MTATVAGIHLGIDTHANRPAGNSCPDGSFYSCSTHGLIYKSNYAGNSWATWATLGAAASGSITSSGYTQNTARLLGRTTASSGAIEEITVGSGLSLSAGSLTATGSSALASGVATVTTNETQSGNNSFADLTTSGPAVTITVNTKVLVTVGCEISWTPGSAANRYAAMGFVLSSGNTLAASRQRSFIVVGDANNNDGGGGGSRTFMLTGLTPGSTVFTSKYNQLGTGSTANYQNRELSVVCLD